MKTVLGEESLVRTLPVFSAQDWDIGSAPLYSRKKGNAENRHSGKQLVYTILEGKLKKACMKY